MPPIIGIGFDLPHEPSRDRAGRACPLLPGADRVRVDPEESCEHNLAHTQQFAYAAHVLRAIGGRYEFGVAGPDRQPPGNGSPDRMTSIAS